MHKDFTFTSLDQVGPIKHKVYRSKVLDISYLPQIGDTGFRMGHMLYVRENYWGCENEHTAFAQNPPLVYTWEHAHTHTQPNGKPCKLAVKPCKPIGPRRTWITIYGSSLWFGHAIRTDPFTWKGQLLKGVSSSLCAEYGVNTEQL